MSLSASKLASGLEALTQSLPESYDEAGQRWAQAYVDYASAAATPFGIVPDNPDLPKPALASALAGIFEGGVPANDNVAIAAGIAAALTDYWLSPPQFFTGARNGLVTLVVGTAALAAALEAVMTANAQPGVTNADACRAIADAIHAFTMTVTVTSALPAPPLIGTIL
jgi:hypothetical protein